MNTHNNDPEKIRKVRFGKSLLDEMRQMELNSLRREREEAFRQELLKRADRLNKGLYPFE